MYILIFSTVILEAQNNLQVEVSGNPVTLLFGVGLGSMDLIWNDNWSTGTDFAFGSGGILVYVNGRHYFNPMNGGDRFNVGTFASVPTTDVKFGLGFFVGYKWVSQNNLTFEIAGGGGRIFKTQLLEFLPYFKLNVGYRFARNK